MVRSASVHSAGSRSRKGSNSRYRISVAGPNGWAGDLRRPRERGARHAGAPLRRVLAGKGFAEHAECVAPEHWQVYFRKTGQGAQPAAPDAGLRIWREGVVSHIDVRGLEPPEPMLAILRLLEQPDCGTSVIVHHEREPMFLYPELAERRWRHEIVEGEPGEVRLRLTRAA